jgi:hypothetical protein
MIAMEMLKRLASGNAMARQSLTGPEWHEIVLGDGHAVPLPAADFDRMLEARLIEPLDDGTFVITAAGRRWLEADAA